MEFGYKQSSEVSELSIKAKTLKPVNTSLEITRESLADDPESNNETKNK